MASLGWMRFGGITWDNITEVLWWTDMGSSGRTDRKQGKSVSFCVVSGKMYGAFQWDRGQSDW